MKIIKIALLTLLWTIVSFAGEINVMSFNIRYGTANDGDNSWDNRKELVFDVIRKESPDVIGLQEALRFQIDEIRQSVPDYAEIGVGREGGEKGEYSAILYRKSKFEPVASGTFWLSDTPEKPSISWGNNCIRICTWARFLDRNSNDSFYHFNTHLDHRSQSSREKSVRLILQRIQERKGKIPFVLTGDFNAGESNPAILFIKGKRDEIDEGALAMVDTFRVLYPDEKQVGTFNGFKGISTGDKIDYIFASPELKVIKASIIPSHKDAPCPSDHFPVTARLLLNSGR